ncbi:hypothetical protein IYQ92_03225 [Streptococcus sp. HF-1907]|uniref:hypothetical protein n=1 Tax=Streptococcus sp. HF-1907 TaxID=2785793 RepID=UPI00189DA0F8|nr:hypothetical protein [Streptococcus sp. HF-1907]MBF7094278.1 hypothetical protein [Streptococcus sp. HF-1907]
MTTLNIILLLLVCLAVTWAGIITVCAINQVKKAKAKVAYYQRRDTQYRIAQHVIENGWFKNGGEVFR